MPEVGKPNGSLMRSPHPAPRITSPRSTQPTASASASTCSKVSGTMSALVFLGSWMPTHGLDTVVVDLQQGDADVAGGVEYWRDGAGNSRKHGGSGSDD